MLREVVERVQLSATAIRLSLAIRLPNGAATDSISLTQGLSDADEASRRRDADGAAGGKPARFDLTASIESCWSRTPMDLRATRNSSLQLAGSPARAASPHDTYELLMPLAFLSPRNRRRRLWRAASRRSCPSSASPDESNCRRSGAAQRKYWVLPTCPIRITADFDRKLLATWAS